jgi:hypothetical protein
MISNESYFKLIDGLELMSLGALWYKTDDHILYSFPKHYSENYQGRIELFCLVLRRLMEEHKVCLDKNGELLQGTIDEQLALFKNAFPEEERMKEIDHYWWYLDDCPATAVWILDREIEGFTTPAGKGKFYFWT